MKASWPWLVAILLPGGSLIALGVWLRRRWLAREAAVVDGLIRPARQVFEKLSAKDYDELRKEAGRRYAAASLRQTQSARIASGEAPPEAKLIEIVR